jgi:hypothetical protein
MPSFAEVDAALGIICKGFFRGLWCALDLPGALRPLAASRAALLGALKVAAANVALVAGSDAIVLHRGLKPAVRAWGAHLYADAGLESSPSPPAWVEPSCALLFYVAWIFPIWGLIYMAVNAPTYGELAAAFFEAAQQRAAVNGAPKPTPRRQPAPNPRGTAAEEETYRYLFFFILLVQKYALLVLPEATSLLAAALTDLAAIAAAAGRPVAATGLRAAAAGLSVAGGAAQAAAFVFTLLLSSLYAFDYAWSLEGVRVARCLPDMCVRVCVIWCVCK